MTNRKRALWATTALFSGLLVAGAASAQSSGTVATEATELDTVVVTGVRGPFTTDGTLVVTSKQTDFQQVVTQGWKAENAQKRMDTLLTASYTSATLDGVLSPNDTLGRAIITSVKAAGKPVPVVTGQDSEVESVKSIMAGEQYSTINKDTRNLVKDTITMLTALQKGQKPKVTDEKSYNNGVKVVPANLLAPVIVTKENAKEAYANDPTLSKVTG